MHRKVPPLDKNDRLHDTNGLKCDKDLLNFYLII